MHHPSKVEVINKFTSLIAGEASRESVAQWAESWVSMKNPPEMDEAAWGALKFLCAADLITTDKPYLYDVEDFQRELKKLIGSGT